MAATLEIDSTLTDRYQTTVPESVRRALKLRKRDKIHYSILSDGTVLLTRTGEQSDDPVLGQFITFLARDMTNNPQRIQALDAGLVNRIQSLVGDVALDLDVPLSAEDE